MFNTVFITARQFFPIVSQINPANALPCYFCKTNFRFILLVTSRSSKWFVPPGFPAKIPVCCSYLSHMPHPLYSWLNHSNIWWGVQIMKPIFVGFPSVSFYFWETAFHAHLNNRQNYSSAYFFLVSSRDMEDSGRMVADIPWTEWHKLLPVLMFELTAFLRIRKVRSLRLGPESALFHFSLFCGSSDTLQINTRMRSLEQCRADHILSTAYPMNRCYVVQAIGSFFK